MGKKQNTNSPFWKPAKVGDKLEGKFVEFQETSTGSGAMKLSTGLVGLSTVLKSLLRPVARKMKAGDPVRIVFTGTTKGQRGKPARLFDVWVKGKKLEGMFAPADRSAIDRMFQPEEPRPGKRGNK